MVLISTRGRVGITWDCVGTALGGLAVISVSHCQPVQARHYLRVEGGIGGGGAPLNSQSSLASRRVFTPGLCLQSRIEDDSYLCLMIRTASMVYRSRGPEFDCLRYQNFRQIMGIERGRLSLVRITEELLGRSNSGSGLEK
jgi:hypothetical protein